MNKRGFTLAEVLITLAVIGVVAALTIPSVISNTQQQEFKTGLRKAVSVLNSAITMNMALDGETPYDNANLMGYLMKHMNVLKTTSNMYGLYYALSPYGDTTLWNAAFYTTDGMRFDFRVGQTQNYRAKLYESNVSPCTLSVVGEDLQNGSAKCFGCGSLGLNSNTNNTTKPPCLISVDVNGDRKPNPNNAMCKSESCAVPYKYSDPDGKKLTDMFTIMITDKEAIPYGIAAQKAMYQSQK